MSGRTPAENAQVALLLEVSGTPKPGNVDRERDFEDLRFEHFLAGAVGAGGGLRSAEAGAPVGEAFERAVRGMRHQQGGNTQFGALLLLVPLVRAAAADDLTGVPELVEETTVADAAAFYRAFEHVDVFVDDPPADMEAFDVRRGTDAIPALEERGLTLYDVMERSAAVDGVAAEWAAGFERSFEASETLLSDDGPTTERAARAFLDLLAAEPDTFIAKQHGKEVADRVRERAAELRDASRADVAAWGDELVAAGINPGTTADITAAALFVALERGLEV